MAKDTSPPLRVSRGASLDPQRRSLHAILRAHLATFLHAHALPTFVKDELEGYLDCGRLSCGCAVYECRGCGLARVTALSCKGRGFCPRCLGRRMAEGARDLVTRVLAHVRIRQWTFSLPFALRVRLAFDHDKALALWRIAQREIDRRYRRLARRASRYPKGCKAGIAAPRGGSLMVIHRAGSDLKANLHFHSLFLDGARASLCCPSQMPGSRSVFMSARIAAFRVRRSRTPCTPSLTASLPSSLAGIRHGADGMA